MVRSFFSPTATLYASAFRFKQRRQRFATMRAVMRALDTMRRARHNRRRIARASVHAGGPMADLDRSVAALSAALDALESRLAKQPARAAPSRQIDAAHTLALDAAAGLSGVIDDLKALLDAAAIAPPTE
jgi:hypothetical protein